MAEETKRKGKTAEEMALGQRNIGVAEFFAKNKHLLGFDNKRKALLTTIKEAVDNSLDACEEAGILPEISVEIIDMGNDRFRVVIEDNGPGIVREQIPRIFAKLLYGSKFHKLSQSLTYDEPIMIEENGEIKIIKIGEFVDQYCGSEEDKNIQNLNIKVPSFDWKTNKYSFNVVSHVIKHERRNEIVKINTNYGKSVKVTGCHSLFTLDKETFVVKEVEARDLKEGDHIISPKKLPEPKIKNEINLLKYLSYDDCKNQNWYVYCEKEIIQELFNDAKIMHKKKENDKSRKYYQFNFDGNEIDILDDSYKQYVKKGFLPLKLIKQLNLENNLFENSKIRSYYHGKIYDVPVVWPITENLMKFLGLFVAEGHTCKRQIGFTFSRYEKHFVKLVCDFGLDFGISSTVEERFEKNCIRVKLFGGIISVVLRNLCGHRAENKKVPSFVFNTEKNLRQMFIDYLYFGDGHRSKRDDCLMHSTVSQRLANELNYLWLMQGVTSSMRKTKGGNLSVNCKPAYVTSIYGKDVDKTINFSCSLKKSHKENEFLLTKWLKENKLGALNENQEEYVKLLLNAEEDEKYSKEFFEEITDNSKFGYKLRHLIDNDILIESNNQFLLSKLGLKLQMQLKNILKFIDSDLSLLKVKSFEILDEGNEFVYDISVPEDENFVGGLGGISCHNSRGQQGIGISASVMYGQLTTGRASKVISKTSPESPAHQFELKVNTGKNEPEILSDTIKEWNKDHGTKIQIDLEGSYQKGSQSVDEYLKETAVVNPHVTIIYTNPKAEQLIFPRATDVPPTPAKEIKPHPYGIELGNFLKMLEVTSATTVHQFLISEFSKISDSVAKEVFEVSRILPRTKPKSIHHEEAEKILKALKSVKIQAPSADCISPITSELLEKGIKKEVNAEFYTSVTRSPEVYKGYPFQIECCTGDSKLILDDGTITSIKNYVESEDSRNVLSMNEDLKIVPTRIIAKQKFKNIHKLLKIKTKTGRELTLTENNELPIIENGIISWIQAQNVAVGQHLTVPKKYNVLGKIPKIIDLLEPKFVQVINTKLILYLTNKLILKYGKLKHSITDLGINYERLKSFRKNTSSGKPYLDEIEKICFVLGEDFEEIKNEIKEIRFVDNAFLNPNKIKVPEINEDLLYVLGLLDSDGYMNHKSIQFVNLDESLHESYTAKMEYLFNIKIKKYKHNSNCYSKTIFNILNSVKNIISNLPPNLIVSYVKGFVDGDGWVNFDKNSVGIATAKKEKAEFMQTLLLRIGIVSKIEIKKIPTSFGKIDGREIKTKFEKYDLNIGGHENISKFRDLISFRQQKRLTIIEQLNLDYKIKNNKDIFPLGDSLKQFRLENNLYQYQLALSEQTIRQVEKGNQNISRNGLNQILIQKEFLGETYKQLLKLMQSDILCDKIVDITLMPNEEFVYDLTTENGNFIANNVIMHNCALAYGGDQPSDKQANIMRFANRVPLLFQQGGCAVTKGIQSLSWKPYGLNQPNGSLPVGPLTIVVHIASVWVPFTSESKEAIAQYPEILKEIKLALQEAGRNLAKYTAKKKKVKDELKKRSHIEKYIPHLAIGLKEILDLDSADEEILIRNLKTILEMKRGKIESLEFDPTKNEEYDEDWASIGKDEISDDEEVSDDEDEPKKKRKKYEEDEE